MKIAVLVHGGVDRSGQERVIPALLWLLERLARRHEVHVFARDQEPDAGEWNLLGAHVHNIGLAPGRRRRMLATFDRVHRGSPFDVVQGIFGWGGIWAALIGARYRVPVAFHAAGGEFVALRDIGYGMRCTQRDRLAMGVAVRGAKQVTVATTHMQSLARSCGVRAELTPLGVALDQWTPRAPAPRDRARPARLLHVGDLRPVKDQATLLAASARLAREGIDFELDICGLDTLGGALQRSDHARALGEKVRWHGAVDRARLRTLMEHADLLVMSSRHEAGPLVMLEAAVAGVPTVGTSVGHVADWHPDGAIGVGVRNPDALASAITSLLIDDGHRIAIAREAQHRAMAIDAEYSASSFERVYQRICA